MIRWGEVEVEKRAGRETMAGSLCEVLGVWRAWAPWEQKGGQCDRNREQRGGGGGVAVVGEGCRWAAEGAGPDPAWLRARAAGC